MVSVISTAADYWTEKESCWRKSVWNGEAEIQSESHYERAVFCILSDYQDSDMKWPAVNTRVASKCSLDTDQLLWNQPYLTNIVCLSNISRNMEE